MAKYELVQNDLNLLKCKSKRVHVNAYLLDTQNGIVDNLEGYIISGDYSEDASSDVRRTCNFVLHSYDKTYDIGEYNRIWINNRVRIDIGFEYLDEIYWYTKGVFVFDSCSYAYDGSTRDISFQCSDLTTLLDGTHGGIIVGHCPYCDKPLQSWVQTNACKDHHGLFFGEAIVIEGCKKLNPDDDNDDRYEGNDIRKTVIDLLEQYGIKEHNIGIIGQVSCLRGYAVDWKKNRMDTGSTQAEVNRSNPDMLVDSNDKTLDHGSWHMIPYDLEFDQGATLWEVLVKIRDLYPGYEMFFDKDGVFVFQLIPICHHERDVLDHTQFKGLVISENTDLDLTVIRNATKVYGKSIETDRFANTSKFTTVTYNGSSVTSITPTFETTFTYKGDIVIGVMFPSTVLNSTYKSKIAYMTINNKTYPLTERKANVIKYKTFDPNISYKKGECCSYSKIVYKFLKNKSAGKWDASYVERLVETEESESDASNLITYESLKYESFNKDDMFCFKYLQKQEKWVYAGMYQIEGYHENNFPESPFSIGKIGYRLQIKSGGEYDDITTSELAKERAEYETWLTSRFTDSVSLETVIIPFLEVNQKIEYKKLNDGSIDSYIIKSISHSFTDGTMTMTMSKFYELDPFIICS